MKSNIIAFPNKSKLAIKEIYDKKKHINVGVEYARIVIEKTVSRNGIFTKWYYDTRRRF